MWDTKTSGLYLFLTITFPSLDNTEHERIEPWTCDNSAGWEKTENGLQKQKRPGLTCDDASSRCTHTRLRVHCCSVCEEETRHSKHMASLKSSASLLFLATHTIVFLSRFKTQRLKYHSCIFLLTFVGNGNVWSLFKIYEKLIRSKYFIALVKRLKKCNAIVVHVKIHFIFM